ncbi:MAG TPA: radical SAM protein [Anaerolineales bacterium]|nr:radical SAM protein [Anaerolineales bacterium]
MNHTTCSSPEVPALPWKLWIYTNYDCNLRCSYCLVKSGPNAPRRFLGAANVKQLIDEAVELGFTEVFLTGGEPFILNDVYELLRYSSARVKTTVLTNGMLLRGARLERLCEIAGENLVLQVSLDGGNAEDHDHYRGRGSWQRAVDGIKLLQARGFRVRLSTTETPVNTDRLDQVCVFHRSLGISDEDHFIRPLARRGYSKEGIELNMVNLIPEVTASIDGVFWHPFSTDPDMQISRSLFPLADSVARIQDQLAIIARSGGAAQTTFT